MPADSRTPQATLRGSPGSSRRELMVGGCALVLACLPRDAAARKIAPRHRCSHTLCRHHRPVDQGICVLALDASAILSDG